MVVATVPLCVQGCCCLKALERVQCLNYLRVVVWAAYVQTCCCRTTGASYGQELPPHEMRALILEAGRTPRQRTTTYADVADDSRSAAAAARRVPLATL